MLALWERNRLPAAADRIKFIRGSEIKKDAEKTRDMPSRFAEYE